MGMSLVTKSRRQRKMKVKKKKTRRPIRLENQDTWKEEEREEEWSAPHSSFSQRGKRVLARLKKPGGPLKTIRLMKYVKAHKETLRPFREEEGGIWCRKPGKHTASAKMKNTQKPCQYALAKTSTGEKMKKHKKEGTLQWRNGWLYLSLACKGYVHLEMPGKSQEEDGGGEATCRNAECGRSEVSTGVPCY